MESIYSLMKQLPVEEKFGLISQMKRSSISIPSNITEGAGRNSNKEFAYFLNVANGSTTELETQLILVKRLKLLETKDVDILIDKCVEIKKMNFSL